jgi:flagellar motility protein MotE (MotC chaperone)
MGEDVNENSLDEKKQGIGLLGGVLAFLISMLIVAGALGGVIYYLVKNNINNMAVEYEDYIRTLPILKSALPEPEDPGNPKYFTQEQIVEMYNALRFEKESYLKEIELMKEEIEKSKEMKEKYEETILKEVELQETMKKMEEERKKMVETKKELDQLVGLGNPEEFRKYYEDIEEETAKEIYAEVVKKDSVDLKVKEYAKLYEKMEADSAAAIFEEMGTRKKDDIVNTLKHLKKDVAAQILSEMDPEFASELSNELYSLYTNIE